MFTLGMGRCMFERTTDDSKQNNWEEPQRYCMNDIKSYFEHEKGEPVLLCVKY